METVASIISVTLQNLLVLTDFSPNSQEVIQFAKEIATQYGSKIFALHVVRPDPYVRVTPEYADVVNNGIEEAARGRMQQVESCLCDFPHQTTVERGSEIWPQVEQAIASHNIDLILLGTHGRTGVKKLMLGSVAEEVFRRAKVPVLTVGPNNTNSHAARQFKRVLFATDLLAGGAAGLPFAISIARKNHAALVLLHVLEQPTSHGDLATLSAAEARRQMEKMLPIDLRHSSPEELLVATGAPAVRIVETADHCGADLIVLGTRERKHIGLATHLQRTTAYEVVCSASCPVLTVRD